MSMDRYLDTLQQCKNLEEKDVKLICEKVHPLAQLRSKKFS